MTARFAGCSWFDVLPRKRQQVDITSQFKTHVMNKKVSLADRASRMAELAGDLSVLLAIIEVEAKSLAKEQRSPAKKPAKRSAKSTK